VRLSGGRWPAGRRGRRLLAAGVVVISTIAVPALARVIAGWPERGVESFHNVSSAPGLTVHGTEFTVGFAAEPGVVGIAPFAVLRVTAPITLDAVRAYRTEGEVEVLAARAAFSGRGVSPGGYRRAQGTPTVICWRSWPVAGFGPSYPVEGLALVPGDSFEVLLYVRGQASGRHVVRGFHVEYRTGDGKRHVLSGEPTSLVMDLHRPTEPPADDAMPPCHPDRQDAWTERVPGFPV
jgi:hypothetical protein